MIPIDELRALTLRFEEFVRGLELEKMGIPELLLIDSLLYDSRKLVREKAGLILAQQQSPPEPPKIALVPQDIGGGPENGVNNSGPKHHKRRKPREGSRVKPGSRGEF